MTTYRIKQTRWDNWYGYKGTRRVIAFGNSTEATAEQSAHAWLHKMTADDALRVGDAVDVVRNTHWAGHYGTVIRIEDDHYHVSGGSIGNIAPLFDRRELKKKGTK